MCLCNPSKLGTGVHIPAEDAEQHMHRHSRRASPAYVDWCDLCIIWLTLRTSKHAFTSVFVKTTQAGSRSSSLLRREVDFITHSVHYTAKPQRNRFCNSRSKNRLTSWIFSTQSFGELVIPLKASSLLPMTKCRRRRVRGRRLGMSLFTREL